MSFDLRVEGNNLAINPDGSLRTVREGDKLGQDIIKAILTPLGSNPFHRWYGGTISARTIGQMLAPEQIAAEAERVI